MRDDQAELITAAEANERMQAEAERIAWSGMPLGKKIWYGFKRYLNLKDSYPFPRWLIRSKLDKIRVFFTIVITIAVAILLCYLIYWTIVVLAIVDSIGAL